MVERELCHECRQYHHLCGDWRTVVESVGLLVIKYKEHYCTNRNVPLNLNTQM